MESAAARGRKGLALARAHVAIQSVATGGQVPRRERGMGGGSRGDMSGAAADAALRALRLRAWECVRRPRARSFSPPLLLFPLPPFASFFRRTPTHGDNKQHVTCVASFLGGGG